MSTLWPWAVMAFTASGVRQIRFSWNWFSLGIPIRSSPFCFRISRVSSWGSNCCLLKGEAGWFIGSKSVQYTSDVQQIYIFFIQRSVKPIHRFLRGWDVSDTLPLGKSILWIVVLTYGLFGK